MTRRTVRWLVGLVHGVAARNGAGVGARLTIIRHHRVYADQERPLYRLGVSESMFAAQIELLARLGLTPVTVAEGRAWLATGEPGHRVALSFDDGYADNVWRALARLQAVSARATFYLTAGLIEDRRAPWWDELAHILDRTREGRIQLRLGDRDFDLPLRGRADRLRALHALAGALRVAPPEREHRIAAVRLRLGVPEAAPCELATWDTATALVRSGMEVGAHTMTHPHLTTLDANAQRREIGDSIEMIERRLGVRPAGFAYPGGDYDARTVEAALACGLEYAVTTRAGVNRADVPRLEMLRRGLSEGACVGPSGRFSRRLVLAELDGVFDRLRGGGGGLVNACRRVRVLFVVGNFAAGGAERHLLELWSRMDRGGFEVEIACFRREGRFLAAVEALGWPVHELRVGRRIYDPGGLAALARLTGVVRRFRPDVIHGYLFGPNLFAVLAGRFMGVRAVVVAKRNVDAFETPRQRAVQRIAHRLASHVTAVSEAVAETVVALGVPRERITVIPNGVDAARFDRSPADRTLLGVAGAGPVIGSVGCLAPRKDYGTLLEALALLRSRGREFHAVIVGDGSERRTLEARARALGLGDVVHFMGERADVERLLPAMDVFVLSSREEGIPNALLEAMAVGRPSVVTAVGGNREVLEDGETGWMVPPAAPAALADALEEVITRPDEARRRGEAARRVTLEQRGIGTMVRRHEEFYRQVAGAREGG